jgi:SOS response regulatory protein OraA/RecX
MTHPPSPHVPATVQSACALALGWLAARDLSAAEIELRLRRRGCPTDIVHRAIEHLRFTRAIDDERVAMSRARVEASLRGRGRARVLLRLRSIGIDPDTARRAADAVFEDVDQAALLERALARRLKGPTALVRTPAQYRRLYGALVRQGFPPADVRKALDQRRAKSSDAWLDDTDAVP